MKGPFFECSNSTLPAYGEALLPAVKPRTAPETVLPRRSYKVELLTEEFTPVPGICVGYELAFIGFDGAISLYP